MKIIHKLSEYTKSLFAKKSSVAIEVSLYKLLNILSFSLHIEKINHEGKKGLTKLLKNISKNKLDSIFIAQDLAKILNVNNQSIEVEELINLLKNQHNRKTIFNLLRINNEYITTKEGFKQLIFMNIEQKPEVIKNLLSNAEASKLLFNYIDINSKDSKDQTFLHRAVELGNFDIVKLLINKGAKLNCVDQNGCTPLNLAIKSRNDNITNLILDICVKCNDLYINCSILTEEDFEFLWPLADSKGLVLKSGQDSKSSVDQLSAKSINNYPNTAMEDTNVFSHTNIYTAIPSC